MTKLCKVVFEPVCSVSLFSVTGAWAGEGTVANPSIGAEVPLLIPAPEAKIGGCHIVCESGFTTSPGGGQPSDWGMASDCTAAQSALTSALATRATNNCLNMGYDRRCGIVTQVTTTGCYFNGTMFQIDAYADHSCGYTICDDPGRRPTSRNP